jgi:hypothetical protein
MSFPPDVVERLLVACHRHCCLCHKFAGNKMEIHHIIPRSKGGEDSEENGIPLCFDCHAEAQAYNPDHPKGRRIRESELRKHKEQWFAIAARSPWSQSAVTLGSDLISQDANVVELLPKIETAELWRPEIAEKALPTILKLRENGRTALVKELSELLSSRAAKEETQWNAALVVEFLVQWDPQKIPAALLLTMANDPFFSVRSCAAVSYYYMAGSSPDHVPVETLGRLALASEDWYVMSPATSAMLRLARTRPVAVEVLAQAISDESKEARDHAAHTFERLAKVNPAALREDVADHMIATGYTPLVLVGKNWKKLIEDRHGRGEGQDHQMF